MLVLMLLTPVAVDGLAVRHRSVPARPRQASSPTSEPWSQPCGEDSVVPPVRVRRAARSRQGYWQRRFCKLEQMALSMVEIADEIVASYVSVFGRSLNYHCYIF